MPNPQPRLCHARVRDRLLAGVVTSICALFALGGCHGQGLRDGERETSVAASSRPRLRSGDPRLPDFAGGDPVARRWAQVDGLLWMDRDGAAAWREGRVNDGRTWVPKTHVLPPGTPAERGFLLRTSHVSLRTNARWDAAEEVARVGQAHVESLFRSFAEAIDLRFPGGPLPVVAHETRDTFGRALRGAAPGHFGWGAFYDGGDGTVHVSLEPAPAGALPLQADVRHEMTHQILDLSTPSYGRAKIFRGLYLWLWEGFAVWSETLGDDPGQDTGGPRRERFALRRARGEVTSLTRLFALSQSSFEGRHYDQAGILVAFLMSEGVPGGRRAVLETLRDLLRGRARAGDLERRVGLTASELDARWRATW